MYARVPTCRIVITDAEPSPHVFEHGALGAEFSMAPDLLSAGPDNLCVVTILLELARNRVIKTVVLRRIESNFAVVPHVGDGLRDGGVSAKLLGVVA